MNPLKNFLFLSSLGASAHGFLSQRQAVPQHNQYHHHKRLFAKKNEKINENFDMKELRQRIHELTNPYHEVFADWNINERPKNVYVILVNPNTQTEGFHTLEKNGSNVLLAFQSKKASYNFAASLKAQQNFDNLLVSPKCFELESIEAFGEKMGVFVQIVPDGVEIIAPKKNVQNLGEHNPHLKDEKNHLDYIFDMFELEVDEEGLLVLETETCWE